MILVPEVELCQSSEGAQGGRGQAGGQLATGDGQAGKGTAQVVQALPKAAPSGQVRQKDSHHVTVTIQLYPIYVVVAIAAGRLCLPLET